MQIKQHWQLLNSIPSFPNKISSVKLQQILAQSKGGDYSLRTIQRELLALAKMFDLDLDKNTKPYGWFWKEGCGLAVSNKVTSSLPVIDIGLSNLSETVAFEAYFYQDLKQTLQSNPLADNQKITKYDDDWFKLKATVIVDQNFIQWLLSCGDRVELLAPTDLRNWVAQMFKNTQEYYS